MSKYSQHVLTVDFTTWTFK